MKRRLNIKKVNEKKRSNTKKQNVKVAVAPAKIIADTALQTKRRCRKSRNEVDQKKIKYHNTLKKKNQSNLR